MKIQKRIKSAVIGLGVGAHQAKALYNHPDCQLKWICDINKSRLSKIGSELVETKRTDNEEDVLNDPEIDLICVASYDEAHHRQVIKSLKQGKHVYVEKPMCISKSEAKDIRLTLKSNPKLRLSSNMVLRTCPLFKKVRNVIQSNKIGEIYHIEADYLWGRKNKLISGWRSEAEFYSIIHGAAVHMIDLALWIYGKKPCAVQAIGNKISTLGTLQRHNDFAVLLLQFDNLMSVKISAHGGCVHPHFHTLKVFGQKSSFFHESTGTVWIDSSSPDQMPRPEHSEYPAKAHRNQALVSFVNSLLSPKTDPLVPQEDVFSVMSICLAAEEAVQSRKILPIEYL